MTMKSINFVVLGDASIANDLGKKGAVTDITFYERKASDKIFSFIVPSGFPEKMQALVQSISLAEYAIVNVKSIDKNLGEQIVALDCMKMQKGFILANGFDEDVKKIIKSTSLESYEFVTADELKQRIDSVEPVSIDGNTKVVLDAAFEVKGVGTVALGVVRRGTLKKYDEMEMFPQNKGVIIRSIQMHDDDVDSAVSPGRVGLALKGTEAKEMSRGDVIGTKGSLKVSSEVPVNFEKSKFYRGEVGTGSGYHICAGLQIRPARLDGGKIISDKPIAFESGDRIVVLDLNSSSVRVVGSGTVL